MTSATLTVAELKEKSGPSLFQYLSPSTEASTESGYEIQSGDADFENKPEGINWWESSNADSFLVPEITSATATLSTLNHLENLDSSSRWSQAVLILTPLLLGMTLANAMLLAFG
jgi:hypothetical protein